jgi:D-xylose transport system substrate-binding protein
METPQDNNVTEMGDAPKPVSPADGGMPQPMNTGSAKPKKNTWLWLGIGLAVLAAAVAAYMWWASTSTTPTTTTTNTTPKFRIGLSLDTYKELRWQKDRDLMVEHAKALGGTVTVLSADSDDAKQVSQIENLITQKVDAIIIVAHDAKAVAPTIAEAHAAGIKVIAYDRLILDSDVDMYVTFDSTIIGKYEAQKVMAAVPTTVTTPNVALVGGADTDNNSVLVHNGIMGVLDPLIANKKAKIVYDKYTPDWSADAAYVSIKAFLDGGGKLDAVIAANDGTAGGVIKALKTHSLDGKIPVSGSDAELPAVQRIVAGTQTMTIYTPFKNLAYKAIDIAYDFVQGKTPTANGTTNNGKTDVPSVLLDSTPVTKANIDDVIIKGGVFSHKDVYGTD